ncbi:hypothetical protein [Parafrankia elaeagni]|uniref:hypothetical protein n=1 Tax=Parafrankia elaeagni TaxID=222534 RepID=UPI00039DFEE0|nr:hypothetical protein [Parafrankia elaeagni]
MRGLSGRTFVNTSSGAAVSGGSGDQLRTAYAASKSAVHALTRHIAGNWGRQGCAATA